MSGSYIQELAKEIRRRVPPRLIPDDADGLFLIYAALALAKGEEVTGRDVHNAWAAWMASQDANHDSIKPYDELPADVRDKDVPFVHAIHDVVRAGRFSSGDVVR